MTRVFTYLRHNAIALAALFIALAGTSYAAMSIPANSVGTKQLRKHAVTSKKIAKHAVTATSLDPKSIAGHVADWAQVAASGQVLSSGPKATASLPDPGRGLIRVSWHRAIPSNCIAIANPANVPMAPVTADTIGPDGQGSSTFLTVQTFDSTGASVPENFNVAVICP